MKKSASESSSPKPRTKVAADSEAPPKTKPPAPKARKVGKKANTPSNPGSDAPVLPSPILPGAATTLTVVAARVDIGFGNHLFLRGSGPGLNWDVGTPMVNAGSDLWTIDLHGATGPIHCKFLINDELWSMGPDYVIDAGAQLEVTPLF